MPENPNTEAKRIDSFRKGYQKDTPDLIIADYHINYRRLCFEFKRPTNQHQVLEAQKEMKGQYQKNGYKFVITNDYDDICTTIVEYMKNIRIPCEFCKKKLKCSRTLNIHKR